MASSNSNNKNLTPLTNPKPTQMNLDRALLERAHRLASARANGGASLKRQAPRLEEVPPKRTRTLSVYWADAIQPEDGIHIPCGKTHYIPRLATPPIVNA